MSPREALLTAFLSQDPNVYKRLLKAMSLLNSGAVFVDTENFLDGKYHALVSSDEQIYNISGEPPVCSCPDSKYNQQPVELFAGSGVPLRLCKHLLAYLLDAECKHTTLLPERVPEPLFELYVKKAYGVQLPYKRWLELLLDPYIYEDELNAYP